MSEKHLLLFMDGRNNPKIILHPDYHQTAKLFDAPISDDEYVTQEYFDDVRWSDLKGSVANFGVKTDQVIHIHKDHDSMSNYRFDTFERPFGHRFRHWTKNPISIDQPRKSSREYISGLNSSDMFLDLVFSDDLLSFKYVGKTESVDLAGNPLDQYFFVYDLYLVEKGKRGHPHDKGFVWIDPIIRNDGSRP